MPQHQAVLLTGATGLLGQYLLRDLLVRGQPVAVMARDSRQGSARQRIAEIIAFWSQELRCYLPAPVVLSGELGSENLDLAAGERRG